MTIKPLDFKRASWLELFYDVAFVALVAQLTYLAYEHHHSTSDLLHIFLIGYTIFIAWWATTANRNLQKEEKAIDKLMIQVQMVGAFMMSLTMSAVFQGDYMGFFLTFGALRLVQTLMLVRLYVFYPESRPKTYNILEGFLAATALWFATAFVPDPFHFVIALVALALDIFTPLTRGKGNTTRYLNVFHLQERLGLFLMLVIGESMIVVALANTATNVSVAEPSIVFSGLGMMIALWWLYFEHSDERQGVRPRNLILFLHSHGFLFGCIILLSVGYKLAISHPDSLEAVYFVCAGALGSIITIGVIRNAMHDTLRSIVKFLLPIVLVGSIVVYYCIQQELYISAIVAVTVLYCLAALVDRKLVYKRGPVDTSQLPS